mgnify:CR=1 FL=1|jgi:hypothetical protein
MIITLLKLAVPTAIGFVAGVLVGRRNKNLVEQAVNEAKDIEAKVAARIKKK